MNSMFIALAWYKYDCGQRHWSIIGDIEEKVKTCASQISPQFFWWTVIYILSIVTLTSEKNIETWIYPNTLQKKKKLCKKKKKPVFLNNNEP